MFQGFQHIFFKDSESLAQPDAKSLFKNLVKLDYVVLIAIWKSVLEYFKKQVRNYRLLIWIYIKDIMSFKFIH